MSDIMLSLTKDWAIRAALNDSSYLITPRARQRALAVLGKCNNPEDWAARRILLDGGQQQGTHPFDVTYSLSDWAADVRILERYVKELDS